MFTSKADELIGRKIVWRDDSIAECIGYDKHNDFTFRLGNGSVVKSSWYMFENGQLSVKKKRLTPEEWLGMTIRQHCGEACTCVAYRNNNDCDCQFESGKIIRHSFWLQFIKGTISKETKEERAVRIRSERQGQTRTMKCGQTIPPMGAVSNLRMRTLCFPVLSGREGIGRMNPAGCPIPAIRHLPTGKRT